MNRLLVLKSLDNQLARISTLNEIERPQRGWIRAVRSALGMTATQFANRMGVTPSRVGALEKGEMNDSLTLASLRKAAEALDCTLVYALVPRNPLTEIVNERARQKANAIVGRVNDTMLLEGQGVSDRELIEDRDELAADLIRTHARQLWEDK